MTRRLALALILLAASPPWLGASDDAGERERAAATAQSIQLEWPLAGPGPVSDYVRALGAELGRAAPRRQGRWSFTVVRDRAANAFAIGDGRIYVTEGVVIACDDEDEVAAILAHEMAHQIAGHLGPKRRSRGLLASLFGSEETQTVGSVTQALEPAKEREADEISLSLLRRAGFDPHAALSLAERLAPERGTASQHFAAADRVARLRELTEGLPEKRRRHGEAFRTLKTMLR